MSKFRIQRVQNTNFGAGEDVLDVAISAVDTSRAFVRLTNTGHTGAGPSGSTANQYFNQMGITCHIVSAAAVRLTRDSAASNADQLYSFEVVEFIGVSGDADEFVVRDQGLLAVTAAGASTDLTLSGITNINDTVPFLTSQRSTHAARDPRRSTWRAELVTSTSARFTRQTTGSTGEIGYAIVEFIGSNWDVFYSEGTISAANTTDYPIYQEHTQATTADVSDWSTAFIEASWHTPNDTGLDNSTFLFAPDSTTEKISVITQGSLNTGATPAVFNAYIVKNPDLSVSHETVSDPGSADSDFNHTITAVAASDHTMLMSFLYTSGGGTAYGRHQRGYHLSNDTTVNYRGHRTGNALAIRLQVIEFPQGAVVYDVAPQSSDYGHEFGLFSQQVTDTRSPNKAYTPGNTNPWNNPQRVSALGTHASASVGFNNLQDFFAHDFGFTVPSAATIDSITGEIVYIQNVGNIEWTADPALVTHIIESSGIGNVQGQTQVTLDAVSSGAATTVTASGVFTTALVGGSARPFRIGEVNSSAFSLAFGILGSMTSLSTPPSQALIERMQGTVVYTEIVDPAVGLTQSFAVNTVPAEFDHEMGSPAVDVNPNITPVNAEFDHEMGSPSLDRVYNVAPQQSEYGHEFMNHTVRTTAATGFQHGGFLRSYVTADGDGYPFVAITSGGKVVGVESTAHNGGGAYFTLFQVTQFGFNLPDANTSVKGMQVEYLQTWDIESQFVSAFTPGAPGVPGRLQLGVFASGSPDTQPGGTLQGTLWNGGGEPYSPAHVTARASAVTDLTAFVSFSDTQWYEDPFDGLSGVSARSPKYSDINEAEFGVEFIYVGTATSGAGDFMRHNDLAMNINYVYDKEAIIDVDVTAPPLIAIIPVNAEYDHEVQSAGLTQQHNISVASSEYGYEDKKPLLGFNIQPANAEFDHEITSPALPQLAAPDSAEFDHEIQSIGITQIVTIGVNNFEQDHEIQSVDIEPTMFVQSAEFDHEIRSVGVSKNIGVQSAEFGFKSTQVDLRLIATPQSAEFDHEIQSVDIVQIHNLNVTNFNQTHEIQSVDIVQNHFIGMNDSSQEYDFEQGSPLIRRFQTGYTPTDRRITVRPG